MQRVLVALFLTFSAAACSDGIVGSSTVNGMYTLRTLNGSKLPYVVSTSGTSKTEVLGDTIMLYEGFTFAETKHSRTTVNGTSTDAAHTETGSFGITGNSVVLRGNDGGALQYAVVEANVMTFVYNGLTSVFKKE